MIKQISIVTLSLILLQGCQDPPETKATAPLAVSTLSVSESVMSQPRRFNGQVEPAENTPLAFRVEGELQQVLVHAGQRVVKGQRLAELDSDKFEQQLSDATVQYQLASKQLQRGRELYQRKMISNAELDELVANQRLAQVGFEAATARLGYTRLLAPFDGVVSAVEKESFEAVSPGESIVSLYQDDRVYINIAVPDAVIAMINPQQRDRRYQPLARFGSETTMYPVSYREHTSELAPQSQTYQMWFEMPQRDPAILPGTNVTLNVDMAAAGLSALQGYQLPLSALVAGREAGQFYVWKWVDGRVNRVPVLVEQLNNQGAIVNQGIAMGDRVVTSSLRKLREGMVVESLPLNLSEAGSL
ncbi:efflux RND transporter periplasmic adaptor subunit [Photobacterium nomapromontoriensis]|uniref:efflux RND transporter periplasmic adaptor subunit n=1 Tax=Photobacterium nomapromontoriensis TaxID=2910237 RepID=UPI003D132A53